MILPPAIQLSILVCTLGTPLEYHEMNTVGRPLLIRETSSVPSSSALENSMNGEADMCMGLVASRVVIELPAFVSGNLETLAVSAGSRVDKGENLGHIDAARLRLDLAVMTAEDQADKSVVRAELQVAQLNRDVDRIEELRMSSAASLVEVQDVHFRLAMAQIGLQEAHRQQEVRKARRKRLENDIELHVIHSPISGFVEYIYRPAGSYVSEGQPIMRIVSSENIVETMMPLATREQIGIGTRARLILNNGNSIQGRVAAIAPNADPLTRMIRVTITSDRLDKIVPGQQIGVLLFSTTKQAMP